MDGGAVRKPVLGGRGLLLIDDFSRATGLDRATADALVKDRKVEGLFHLDGRVVGVFDDALPTTEQLRSWGLSARDDYDPEQHRSYVDEGADSGALGDGGDPDSSASTWTMSWGDRDA